MLVGGLGLGFTTHEVLSDDRVERVVVAEIEEALVRWFRDGTVPHGPAYLADERLHVHVGDVRQVVAESAPAERRPGAARRRQRSGFLVHDDNAPLYEAPFLHRGPRPAPPRRRPRRLVLRPTTPRSTDALTEVFGACATEPHPVRLQDRDEHYWLHVGQRT